MNIGNVIFIVFISVAIISIIAVIGTEAGNNNTILDNESVSLITSMNYEIDNTYKLDNLASGDNEVTNESTFAGVDPFARQYLEDKSEIAQKKNTLEIALSLPATIVRAYGVSNVSIIIKLLALFFTGASLFLGLYIYKAVRTGEVTD